jgi:hypothetical protein
MTNIYGTIGFSLLEHIDDKNKIMILADMHNTLPSCNNKTNIADWFKSKFPTSEILLEEVPREDFKLKELWTESEHTQQLKNLYLDNPKIINPLDIRPFLIPFSWEVMDNNDPDYKIPLMKYLKGINRFFCLKDPYLVKKLSNYSLEKIEDTLHGKHFLKLKKQFYKYIKECKDILEKDMYYVRENHMNILEGVNDMLNAIMEWFICAKIELKKHRPIIMHAGLFHSDSVIRWLTKIYKYKIIKEQGINSMKASEMNKINGCINIDPNINALFG